MNRTEKIGLFSLSLIAAAMQANASSFQVSEHSAAGLGRAFAGEAAIAEDASVVARNVAGMSFLDNPMFTGAIFYVNAGAEVDARNAFGQTSVDKGVVNEGFVPVFYYTRALDDKWSYGVGGFTNFGFATDYKGESVVQPAADFTEIKTYSLNGSVSYKIQDNLSTGFGLNVVHADASLTSTNPSAFNLPVGPGSSLPIVKGDLVHVSGDDWAFGWNAGVMWEPVQGTRIGASYRSEVKTKLEGKSKSDIMIGTPYPYQWNTDGFVDLILPSIAELSIHQKLNEKFAVHASYMKTGWSCFEEIVVELDNGQKITEPQNYSDVSRWSVGATYQHSNTLALRAGYAYDNSPVNNEDRTFRIPDVDRQWFSLGASYKVDDSQSLDMGYAYIKSAQANISAHHPITRVAIDGEIKSGASHVMSLQYNYSF